MLNLEDLRKLYLDDLSSPINYHSGERSRVRHPGKWSKLDSIVYLNENVTNPISLNSNDRKVWIWSDTHFFHKNIIEFSKRPYVDIPEMNEHLISNFNQCVDPNDVSIWVGDVGFKGTTFINELLDRCNGYKILVVGNHDFNKKNVRKLNFDETHLLYTIQTSQLNLVITHYPLRDVPHQWFNIHGHLHAYPNPYTGNPQHFNVCCELQDYRPIELSQLFKVFNFRHDKLFVHTETM